MTNQAELSIVLHLGETVRLGEVRVLVELLDDIGVPATCNLLIRENGVPVGFGVRSPLQEREPSPDLLPPEPQPRS